jgi:metal-responsive CopG/Arc/MetJ family transcriptional regulator
MAQRVFSVKISDTFLAELESAARDAGLSRHAFVREALRVALDRDLVERDSERRVAALIRAGMAADRDAPARLCRGDGSTA